MKLPPITRAACLWLVASLLPFVAVAADNSPLAASRRPFNEADYPLLSRLLATDDAQTATLDINDWQLDYQRSRLTLGGLSYRRQLLSGSQDYWLGIRMQADNATADYLAFDRQADRARFILTAENMALIVDSTTDEPGFPEPAIDWQQVALPLEARLDELHVTRLEVLLRDYRQQPPLLLPLRLEELRVENLALLPAAGLAVGDARFTAQGNLLGGALSLSGIISPRNKPRLREFSVSVDNLPLPALNDYLRTYAGVDAASGQVSLQLTARATTDSIDGSLRFVTRDAELVDGWEGSESIWKNLKENLADLGISLLGSGDESEQMSGEIPFHGSLDNLQLDTWQLLDTLISNAVAESLGKPHPASVPLPAR